MKKRMKKAIALTMVLILLLSVGVLQAAAASVVKSKRTFKNYVVIGDSIAAGYAMNGIIPDYPYTPDNQLHMTGKEVIEGSYPQIVGDAIHAKSVYKLAREEYTAKNILRLIDPEYDAEMAKPENYYDRFETEFNYYVAQFGQPGDVDYMKRTAVEAIINADVITINLGNNDTFTMALMEPVIRTQYYTYGMAMQPALTALSGTYQNADSLEDWLAMYGSYRDLFTALDENTKEYEKNYDRLVARVRELNPDCEIYVVGMYNLFGQAEPQGGVIQSLCEEMNEELMAELETYYTKTSKWKNDITYVDVSGTEVWDNFPMYTPFFYTNFIVFVHPTPAGHLYMANQIIKAMNKNAKK